MRNAILLMMLCCLMAIAAAGCKSTMDGLESDIRNVLSKVEMDRFKDTTAEQKKARSDDDKYSLTIQTVPEDSHITIVGLEGKYYSGITLAPGNYEIVVRHPGYEDFREWIHLESDVVVNVALDREGTAALVVKKPAASMTKPEPEKALPPEPSVPPIQAESSPRPKTLPASLSGHQELVASLSFSPDGRLLASGSYDNTVILWSLPEGSRLKSIKQEDRIRAVAFSPDGKTLATGGNSRNVSLWDVNAGTLISTFRGLSGRINCIGFSRDGLFLAAGSINEAIIWRISNNRTEAHMVGDGEFYPRFGAINAIAFHPKGADADGFTLAFACQQGIALYKPGTKEVVILPDDAMPNSLAYSPDGRHIAWGARHQHSDNLFFPRFFITDTRQVDETISRADPNARADRVFFTAYTPDGKRLILLSYRHALLYDISTGTVLKTFSGTSQTAVTDAALSPDGKILAATAGDLIRLFVLD